jgi:hypothetical protein
MMFILLPLVNTASTPLLFSENIESLVLLRVLRIVAGKFSGGIDFADA